MYFNTDPNGNNRRQGYLLHKCQTLDICGLDGDLKGPCQNGVAFVQCCKMRSHSASLLKNDAIIWKIVSISTCLYFNHPTTHITLIKRG